MRKNDRKLAVIWAKEHWHVALFCCACLPVLAAILVSLGVLTERAAVAAVVLAVAYVLALTWRYTRPGAGK
jgi:maltodextrin utilization protein YvdJ